MANNSWQFLPLMILLALVIDLPILPVQFLLQFCSLFLMFLLFFARLLAKFCIQRLCEYSLKAFLLARCFFSLPLYRCLSVLRFAEYSFSALSLNFSASSFLFGSSSATAKVASMSQSWFSQSSVMEILCCSSFLAMKFLMPLHLHTFCAPISLPWFFVEIKFCKEIHCSYPEHPAARILFPPIFPVPQFLVHTTNYCRTVPFMLEDFLAGSGSPESGSAAGPADSTAVWCTLKVLPCLCWYLMLHLFLPGFERP